VASVAADPLPGRVDKPQNKLASAKPASAPKKGRPRLGEVSTKPWIELGMSERTYYRRQAEKREGK
jgi:hypothetical protein